MIDSQERSKDNLSVLYLNNKKIQGAKNNEKAVQAFELFADFLDAFKLANTKEIFGSESNYAENRQAREKLKDKFGSGGKCLALQVLQKTKNMKNKTGAKQEQKVETKNSVQEQPKSNAAGPQPPKQENYKAQMNDILEKSNKLDKLMEQRAKMENNKNSSDLKDSTELKPTKNAKVEKKEEPKHSPAEPNQLFGNVQLKNKITPKETHLNTMSNLSSNKKSSRQNDTEEMLISESMGYDISVQSDTMQEFDYMESIENE